MRKLERDNTTKYSEQGTHKNNFRKTGVSP